MKFMKNFKIIYKIIWYISSSLILLNQIYQSFALPFILGLNSSLIASYLEGKEAAENYDDYDNILLPFAIFPF